MAQQQMPGDGGLPLIGHTYGFMTGRLTNTTEIYDKYGPVSWSHAVGKRWVHAEGPDACGAVLQDRDRVFDASGWSLMIGPFFNRGLMLLDGTEHHRHRRIMQEAFTADRLRNYLTPMNRTIAHTLDGWTPGERHFYPSVKQLTLDVATRTFMNSDVQGAEADRLNRAFVDSVRAGTAVIRKPVPGLRWARGLAGRKVLEDYLRPRVAQAREGSGEDLFSALCHARGENDEAFTDDDVVNHMIFLLMAAHDTSTITLTTMAYFLARYPEWQERARAETLALDSPVADYDALDRLTSLDLVMKEALRLVVPVPSLIRRANADTELLGFPVPAGEYVAVHLWGVHHMPHVWPDPERFDPERFAEGRREDKVHRYAYVPFGGGIHKCIGMFFGGMEVKAVMHQLLQRYRLTLPPGYRMPVDWSSLPRPRDGLPIELRPLHGSVTPSADLTRAAS
ncbi:cytochrome P450 [uncultured Jatrophihabitans sp.]|uniref:cytochrome P450 n=1 Tax=uncultured Jatrophihabitans sp. TaxID=1610747 RepID=UPI0035CA50F1